MSAATKLDLPLPPRELVARSRYLESELGLIATFTGRWISEAAAGEPWVEDRVGMNVLRHAVLMSEWWVREHWGRAFEFVQIDLRSQDLSWALMRKRDVQLAVEDLELPADDPREYAALKHNLRQLRRELEHELARDRERPEQAWAGQAAEHERTIRQLQQRVRSYENSLSWKATRPVREVARTLRTTRGRQD
ncbi:MAG TPA: hypothetical protein VKT31_13530 [Solirubrobacteraceae bacterium]|nr:hypothetical protein [Solirubrobacteraceae bacterium]